MLRLCDRFRCTPDVALRQDATVLRLLDIEDLLGWRQAPEPEWGEEVM